MCSRQHQDTFQTEAGQREKEKRKQKEKAVERERDAVYAEASVELCVCRCHGGLTKGWRCKEWGGGPPYGIWVVEAGRRGGLGLWSSVTQRRVGVGDGGPQVSQLVWSDLLFLSSDGGGLAGASVLVRS